MIFQWNFVETIGNPNLFDSTYLNSSWQVCYNVIINAHARTHQKSWLL